uniref:Uncharacterized protein n=1 Tax=Schizaphis graminum TaxID=13262 RepID=A0A2S2PQC2_SCHGA
MCIPNNNIYALDRRRRLRSVPPPPYVLQRAGHVAPRYIVARTRRRAVIRSPATVTDGTLVRSPLTLLYGCCNYQSTAADTDIPPPPPPPPPPDQTARRVRLRVISLSARDCPA